MRHARSHRRFSRDSAHRISMLRNMANSLVLCGQIRTTLAKAKELRPYVERLVTIARNGGGSLHSRRLLLSRMHGNNDVVDRLISVIAPRFVERKGGYTRIVKVGYRAGDAAHVALIEFVSVGSSSIGV